MDPKPNQAQTPATLDVPVDEEMGMDFSAAEGESGKDTLAGGEGDDTTAGAGGDDPDGEGDDEGEGAAEGGDDTSVGGEGDDTVAGGEGDDTTAGADGKDKTDEDEEEEEEEEQPKEDPQTEQELAAQRQEQAQKVAAFRGWEGQFNKVAKSLEDGSYDPLDNTEAMKVLTAGFKYLREGLIELHGHVSETRQERQAKASSEGYWKSWAGKNKDIPLKQARAMFQEELNKAEATYKHPEAARAVASEKWKSRLSMIRARSRAKQQEDLKKDKGKKAVIPAGGTGAGAGAGAGRVLPKGTRTTQPPAAPKDTTSKLRNGAYGNVAGAFA